MEASGRGSPQKVTWHAAPPKTGVSQTGAGLPFRQVPAGPRRTAGSLRTAPGPTSASGQRAYESAMNIGSGIVSQYLGYGGPDLAGDRNRWMQSALTGQPDRKQAPEVPMGDAPRRQPRLGFPEASDPRLRADLGKQVLLRQYGIPESGTGRSLGWGQEKAPPMSWTAPVGGTAAWRPVEVSVVVRDTGRTSVKPESKHAHAWDDGETVEYHLGGRGGDRSVAPSEGFGKKLSPVTLNEAQQVQGVVSHRSVLVRTSPASAPSMVVLQARQPDGKWLVRQPASDSRRETTGQAWRMLELPHDTRMAANPYDNVDRAEHPQRWRDAQPDDILYLEGYPAVCMRLHKSAPLIPRADRLDVFCADAQGDDAHRRLALRHHADGSEEAPTMDYRPMPGTQYAGWPDGQGMLRGRVYTLRIPEEGGRPAQSAPVKPSGERPSLLSRMGSAWRSMFAGGQQG